MIATELDAATIYARAWNRLDCIEFIEVLAPDAHYASQWVLSELESKEAIKDYLMNKMKTIKDSNSSVFAELAIATESFPEKNCVALAQGDKQIVNAVVVFTVEGGYVQRFDLCIPELFNVKRSGKYPN